MTHFDCIVIGKGLIGTAAAKYLSLTNKNIAVIGPDEPVNYEGATVFASHYDQARIQRRIGIDAAWTRLNVDSVKKYPTIQAQSGINFHHPVGCLYVNPYGKDGYLLNAPTLSEAFNAPFKSYKNSDEIKADFKGFNFPIKAQGLFETAPCGCINPRLLVQAQLAILEQNKATILKETVISLKYMACKRHPDSFGTEGVFQLKTLKDNTYSSNKVLLATGSFINFLDLIPDKLDLKTKSEVIILAKLSEKEAIKLAHLPSLLYEIDENKTEGIYLTPPVKYPDGHYYLKMGCNIPEDIYFDHLEDIQNWFKNGNSEQFAERLIKALKAILPNVFIENYLTKRCIISRTPHGRPYIDETKQKGLYIAGGCNGYSAMCSDGIGHVAADLIMNGEIPKEYAANSFEIVYQK